MSITSALGRALFGLMFFCLLFAFVERVLGRARGPWLRRGCWTDAAYWFFTIAVIKPMNRLALMLPVAFLVWLGCASVTDFRNNAYQGFGPLAAQPLALQAIEVYLLADFIAYWTHRLFHRGKWWPFHAVHHSSEHLDWLSAVRVHPVNDLVNKLLQASPLLLLGFNPMVTLSTAPFFTLYAIFLHARVDWDFGPLRWIIATPVFHRWHHSRQAEAIDKNFAGLFPLWDLLFGTLYLPRDKMPEDFGVLEKNFPQDLPGQLWQPLANLWRPGRSADKTTPI